MHAVIHVASFGSFNAGLGCRVRCRAAVQRRRLLCRPVSLFHAYASSLRGWLSASMQVSNEGDVLYVLPRGFRGAIAARSWRLRAEPTLKKVPALDTGSQVPRAPVSSLLLAIDVCFAALPSRPPHACWMAVTIVHWGPGITETPAVHLRLSYE